MDSPGRKEDQLLDEQYTDHPTDKPEPSEPAIPRFRDRHGISIPTFLLVTITSSVVTLIVLLILRPAQTKSIFITSESRNSFVPDFPYNTPVEFHLDEAYTNPSWEEAYNELALNVFPSDGGFIAVPNPSSYGLEGGFPLMPLNDSTSSPQEAYTLSVFHQLHCLAGLRKDMQLLIEGKPREHELPGEVFTWHNDHCFEYLRQAIMCASDTSLEKMKESGGRRVHVVDGWGAEHTCRNFEDVTAFAEEHRDTEWIEGVQVP